MCPGPTSSANAVCAVIFCVLLGSADCQYPGRCLTPLGQNGSCTWNINCYPYGRAFLRLEQHDTELPADVRKLKQLFNCEPDHIKVCCPFEEGNDPDSVYRDPPSSIDGHRNLGLLPDTCGRSKNRFRIYGGQKTGVLEFPWMALISTVEGNIQNFTCGGTIINERYILTAAHCITNLGAKVLAGVRLGEHDYSKERDCLSGLEYCNPPVQNFLIEKVIPHPGYVPPLENDIGLLRVQGVIDFSRNNTQPVCLPVSRELQEMRLDWEIPVLPGWGLTNKDEEGNILERGERSSTALLKIDLPIVSNKKCGQTYNRSIRGGVSFRHVCAGGERGYSSCNGDSGGPLLIFTPYIGAIWSHVQIGILSGGALRCGIKNAPSISTRVAHYMNWILDQLEP